MEKEIRYRHELKYSLKYSQYLEIRNRIRRVAESDSHAGPDGRYKISSIYFDNIYDKALREKKGGYQKREKFRIRFYDDDLSHIILQKKMKVNNLCMKFDAPISEEECRMILRGETEWMISHSSELVKELYAKMKSQLLRPRIMISYYREAYVYGPGNVRVTFDSQIGTTLYQNEFLNGDINSIFVTDKPGDMVLEIKYDQFLPEIIEKLIQTGVLRQQAFSKYGVGRKFG